MESMGNTENIISIWCENYQYSSVLFFRGNVVILQRKNEDNLKILIMEKLKIETKRGVLLDGVLFGTEGRADTVLIAITGIHGNF